MITASAGIGLTIFYSDGEALEVAGPGGILQAFVVISIVAICVLEGVSEMIQMFSAQMPSWNIKAFVDQDLAYLMRIAYC